MRSRLMNLPWWVLSLISGGTYGLVTSGLMALSDGEDFSWVRAVVSGVVFGAVMGPFLRWMQKRASGATSSLGREERRVAVRAVTRGPLPTDPRTRASTRELLVAQLTLLGRLRWFNLPVFTALLVANGWLAVRDGGWWWAGVALFTGFSALGLLQPIHLRRRLRLLDDTQPAVRGPEADVRSD